MLPALVTPVDLRLRRTLVRFVILLYKFSQMPQIFTDFFLCISVKSVGAKFVAAET